MEGDQQVDLVGYETPKFLGSHTRVQARLLTESARTS